MSYEGPSYEQLVALRADAESEMFGARKLFSTSGISFVSDMENVASIDAGLDNEGFGLGVIKFQKSGKLNLHIDAEQWERMILDIRPVTLDAGIDYELRATFPGNGSDPYHVEVQYDQGPQLFSFLSRPLETYMTSSGKIDVQIEAIDPKTRQTSEKKFDVAYISISKV